VFAAGCGGGSSVQISPDQPGAEGTSYGYCKKVKIHNSNDMVAV